jgi:cytochrome c
MAGQLKLPVVCSDRATGSWIDAEQRQCYQLPLNTSKIVEKKAVNKHMKRPDGNCPRPPRLTIPLALSMFALVMAGPVFADGDAVNGEKIFKKCMACHSAVDKTNKVGPYLLGIVDRAVASIDTYKYSDAMKEYAASTKIWDEAALAAYLENPRAVVPKTKMAFPGLKKTDDRNDVIAYLKTKM